MDEFSKIVLDYAGLEGSIRAGIATIDTLTGGPTSTDLSYVLPGAKSAVVFSFAMDQSAIPDYLGKKNRRGYEKEYYNVNSISSGVAVKMQGFLRERGHQAAALAANDVYRTDPELGPNRLYPPVSLRYLAAASGVATFGWSGNMIDEKHGACIILGGVVTTAELTPTAPLNQDDNYCDGCRICSAACTSRLMNHDKMTEVTLGDHTFSYSARRTYLRCAYVCGGYTGLHKSGKWSTWSPGRFPIPEQDEEFLELLVGAGQLSGERPVGEGGRYHSLMNHKLYTTCGNCQIVCVPDKEERKRRLNLLKNSGVVLQNADGSLEPIAAEDAEKRLSAMTEEQRRLYTGRPEAPEEMKPLLADALKHFIVN
ncbi:MAG: epoxyqueuosine reductase [Deltaproteobacteria bacterium]|nr:epoxyqueuosine reductase [Deltaproteobacteria bacterium]MBW1813275.1 epoxyqueuosine reductase [Deltaproteobacteria bacterium]MBW1846338.1 epoxyqueuosine reductase [Deltaproteobacteria bacterium]MBW2181134.1 epoxyqueuosine reductase [Deltaproteobacteria bacterium]